MEYPMMPEIDSVILKFTLDHPEYIVQLRHESHLNAIVADIIAIPENRAAPERHCAITLGFPELYDMVTEGVARRALEARLQYAHEYLVYGEPEKEDGACRTPAHQ